MMKPHIKPHIRKVSHGIWECRCGRFHVMSTNQRDAYRCYQLISSPHFRAVQHG